MISDHDLTVAGYVVLLTIGVALELAGHSPRTTLPPLEVVIGRAMGSRPGRVAIVAGWAWVGLHFFAR